MLGVFGRIRYARHSLNYKTENTMQTNNHLFILAAGSCVCIAPRMIT